MGAAAMFQRAHAPGRGHVMASMVLMAVAVVAVLAITNSETVRESTGDFQQDAPPSGAVNPSAQLQLSQQLAKYDMAIKRVDDGIQDRKVQLVAQSQKLGQATQLAVHLHDKLVQDHQALLAEAARSRAMKQLRSQLAAKQTMVAAERQRLQADALQLAEIEQRARALLSKAYTPNQQELQAVARETNITPPPPLSLAQSNRAAVPQN